MDNCMDQINEETNQDFATAGVTACKPIDDVLPRDKYWVDAYIDLVCMWQAR